MTEENTAFVSYTSKGGVGTLTLDRPPANVLNIPMLEQLESSLELAAQEQSIKVLVLKATGKIFCAGVDIADHTPERVGEMIPLFDRVCVAIYEFPTPTLAVIQGHALGGGCELVICCDLAVMSEGARIGQPEIRLGAIAPVAALRLPALVGSRWAAKMLVTGETIEAEIAQRIGLVHKVVPANAFDAAVDDEINQLDQLSGAALRIAKRATLLGEADWTDKLEEMERLYLERLMKTEDAKEGLQAFLEKRAPVWKDR